MIRKRSEDTAEFPSVHCFNTFMYPRLKEKGYNSVKRWTKKVNILEKEIIIFPIHLGNVNQLRQNNKELLRRNYVKLIIGVRTI